MKNKTIFSLLILTILISACTPQKVKSLQEKEHITLEDFKVLTENLQSRNQQLESDKNKTETNMLKFKEESEKYQTWYAQCTGDLRTSNSILKDYKDALAVCKSKNG